MNHYHDVTHIRALVDDLELKLSWWNHRIGDSPTVVQIQARNEAVVDIDGLLRELHAMRQTLVTEGRRADDEIMRRNQE